MPTGPQPQHEAGDQPTDTDPSWSVEDGTGLTYDVYFGTAVDPPLVSGAQAGLTYDPGVLDFNTTYYWKIVSRSGTNTFESDIWNFTTIALPDLVMLNATTLGLVGNRQTVDLTWRVENQGTLATPAQWVERLRVRIGYPF